MLRIAGVLLLKEMGNEERRQMDWRIEIDRKLFLDLFPIRVLCDLKATLNSRIV